MKKIFFCTLFFFASVFIIYSEAFVQGGISRENIWGLEKTAEVYATGVEGASFETKDGKEIHLEPYSISKYEVTQGLYEKIMADQTFSFNGKDYQLNALPSEANRAVNTLMGVDYKTLADGERQSLKPAEKMSFYDMLFFCNALSEKSGLKPAYEIKVKKFDVAKYMYGYGYDITDADVTFLPEANGYRLPTEEEWEFAARGGKTDVPEWNYKFSGENTDWKKVSWYGPNSIGKGRVWFGWTHEVGLKKPNALGLYDMSGNVSETCFADWTGKLPDNFDKSKPYKLIRGGSWYDKPEGISFKYFLERAEEGSSSAGFRLVRSVGKNPPASFPKEPGPAPEKKSKWKQGEVAVEKIFNLEKTELVYATCDSDACYKKRDCDGGAITLSPFAIGRYEVTRELYKKVMEGEKLTISGTEYELNATPSGDEEMHLPVSSISLFDAIYFCNALSLKTGREPAYSLSNMKIFNSYLSKGSISFADIKVNRGANGFRLPTDIEWNFAARGGNVDSPEWKWRYSGADTGDIDSVAWHGENSDYTLHEVGLKKANALGIYDMTGNVSEIYQKSTISHAVDYYTDMKASWGLYNSFGEAGGSFNDCPSDSYREEELAISKFTDMLYSFTSSSRSVGLRIALDVSSAAEKEIQANKKADKMNEKKSAKDKKKSWKEFEVAKDNLFNLPGTKELYVTGTEGARILPDKLLDEEKNLSSAIYKSHRTIALSPFVISQNLVSCDLYNRVMENYKICFNGNEYKLNQKIRLEDTYWYEEFVKKNNICKVQTCDAILFCNALSEMTGLEKAYEVDILDIKVRLNFETLEEECAIEEANVYIKEGASGYRLLNGVEWYYAKSKKDSLSLSSVPDMDFVNELCFDGKFDEGKNIYYDGSGYDWVSKIDHIEKNHVLSFDIGNAYDFNPFRLCRSVKAENVEEKKTSKTKPLPPKQSLLNLPKTEEAYATKVPVTVSGAEPEPEFWDGVFEHKTITINPFIISKYEVTQQLYYEVMKDAYVEISGILFKLNPSPSYCSEDNEFYQIADGEKVELRPVEGVNIYDMCFFCNELSKKEGLNPAYKISVRQLTNSTKEGIHGWLDKRNYGHIIDADVELLEDANGYRLPSCAEWEFAAKGGNPKSRAWTAPFSGMEERPDNWSNEVKDPFAWHIYNICSGGVSTSDRGVSGKKGYGPHEVGLKKPNALGLYDMSGNIWEICFSLYDSPAEKLLKVTGETKLCIMGSGWKDTCDPLYWNFFAYHWFTSGDLSRDSYGFRIVRNVSSSH